MKKKCAICCTPLHGRIDKKFCSDYCRNKYHNQLTSYESLIIRRINYFLRKNRRILLQFMQSDQETITLTKLANAGFDFNLMTSVQVDQLGRMYYFCYEQGYSIDHDGELKLIQKKIEKVSGQYTTGNIFV